jgi:hypothetical protein
MANVPNLDYSQSLFPAAAFPIRRNFSIPEFAHSCGVSVRTMYREIAEGELETTKIRSRRVITPEQQDRYDERKKRQGGCK